MVAHQAIRQGTGVEPIQGDADDFQKRLPVAIVIEDRFAPVAARGD